jgi:hypothetical protein
MLDRQKLETILSRRFPGSRRDQVAAAANAIMGLSDEWEEVLHDERQFTTTRASAAISATWPGRRRRGPNSGCSGAAIDA